MASYIPSAMIFIGYMPKGRVRMILQIVSISSILQTNQLSDLSLLYYRPDCIEEEEEDAAN